MPFGVGYDSVGQGPGAQQGFQQQLTQLQQQMPQLLERLKDPNYRMQAAQQLAGQMPAPPPNFVGGGGPGAENSVGLPQGGGAPPPSTPQPGFQANPFDFGGSGGTPASLAQARSAQQNAAQAFGATPPSAPMQGVGVAPEAGPGGGGGGGYMNSLFQQLMNPSVAPGMNLPGDFLTPAISQLPMSLLRGIF